MKNLYLILIPILLGCQDKTKTYSWQEKTPFAGTPSLRGVSVYDKDVIWVSGSEGNVVKSEDGGHTWQEINIPTSDSLDFRDIEILSKQEVLIMSAGAGTQSNIFKTQDGGNTWKKVLENPYDSGFFNGIAFLDEKVGVLGGDPIDGKLFLMRTTDGGDSWRLISPEHLPPMNEGEIGGFAASGSHLAVHGNSMWVASGGVSSRVFYSHDKGDHWEVVYTPIMQGESSQGIFSLDFYNEKVGIAVGGDHKLEDDGRENVMLSKDSGHSWLLADGFPAYQSAVRYLSENELVSVGPASGYYSQNGGQTWMPIDGKGYHTLDKGADGTVWAAGSEGRVARLIID